ncbi:hypothetical protein VDG1235_2355 [Verrucomicrobiia bacterium DG1235]|nr:hypothetical protein VDG1235_2355 [Verrucomicrobiae bacterium DG1235]
MENYADLVYPPYFYLPFSYPSTQSIPVQYILISLNTNKLN